MPKPSLLLLLLVLLAPARGAPADLVKASFRVHTDKTFQTITGFGAGVNPATWNQIGRIRSATDQQRAFDLLYGDVGVRLNVVRLTVPPAAQPLAAGKGEFRYDWEGVGGGRITRKALAEVLKRSHPILYAVPFTPPARWKDTGQLTHGGSLKREHYQEYAEYLADYLAYYRKALGREIDVFSVQNEPGVDAKWDSCIWTGEQLRDFLKVLAAAVHARGLKPRFMLSEGGRWENAWELLQPALHDPAARALLGVLASHSYGPPESPARGEFAAAAASEHLPVWMSEYSLMRPVAPDDPGMDAALRIAKYLHRDLVEAHASVWIYCFAIFRPQVQGSMGVLSPPSPDGRLIVPKRLWSMANYSRFAREGWKLMQVDGEGVLNTGFVSPSGREFAVVAVNEGEAPRPVSYDFGGRNPGALQAYVTSSERDLAPAPAPQATGHGFTATLTPRSVTTFAGRLAP